MTTIGIIKLTNKENDWIIGLPDRVEINSPGFSSSIQIKYNNRPNKEIHLAKESYHKHTNNIDECYLVLSGWLKIRIENKLYTIHEKEIIRVPSHYCHIVEEYSLNVEYLTIRAPISNIMTKENCKNLI